MSRRFREQDGIVLGDCLRGTRGRVGRIWEEEWEFGEERAITGGWTEFRRLTRADYRVFREALEGFCGYEYRPFLVSTQVVAGTNYRFIAEQIDLRTCEVVAIVLVEVFVGLNGDVTLEEIRTLRNCDC